MGSGRPRASGASWCSGNQVTLGTFLYSLLILRKESVVIWPRRTPKQDFEFPIQQLVEIAVRSLSPGINDPNTATSCIQWLSAALAELARRGSPSSQPVDEAGRVRLVLAEPVRFCHSSSRPRSTTARSFGTADAALSCREASGQDQFTRGGRLGQGCRPQH